jgi:hypothetical protein
MGSLRQSYQTTTNLKLIRRRWAGTKKSIPHEKSTQSTKHYLADEGNNSLGESNKLFDIMTRIDVTKCCSSSTGFNSILSNWSCVTSANVIELK